MGILNATKHRFLADNQSFCNQKLNISQGNNDYWQEGDVTMSYCTITTHDCLHM